MNSKLAIHRSGNATGLQPFYDKLIAAGCPLSAEFSLGFSITSKPPTISIFRDQRFGAVPPTMYQGDPVQVANDWYDQYVKIWRLNPAQYYAFINETNLLPVMDKHGVQMMAADGKPLMREVRGTILKNAADAQYYNAFTLQMQARAHADGFKLCLFEFATGNPQLDLIQYILPACRAGKLAGDVWGQHIYWDEGSDQSFNDGPLYYQRILAQLTPDAVLDFHFTEVSPGNGFNTVSNAVWFAEMDRIDHALMLEPRVKSLCAFDAGGRDSNIAPVFDQYADLIISNSGFEPPPSDDLTERVTRLEFVTEDLQHQVNALRSDLVTFQDMLLDHERRIEALEGVTPPPLVTTATLTVTPSTITQGESVSLTWTTTNAQSISITPNIGAVSANGSMAVTPQSNTTYVLTAIGANNTAIASAAVTVKPKLSIIYKYNGVGVAHNQPLSVSELNAYGTASSVVNAVKLFTMPDAGQMVTAINAIKAKRSDAFIMARLFFSVNPPSMFSARDVYNFCKVGMDAAYASGVRYFETYNEPNVYREGMFFNWLNGVTFATFLNDLLTILRSFYPLAKFGYPGLSPNPDTGGDNPVYDSRRFLSESMPAAQQCDWIGVHQYWSRSLPDRNGWKATRDLFPNKPIIITEFSDNDPGVMVVTKGGEYRVFYDTLTQEPGVLGAFCFALKWPGDDPNHEGWVDPKGKVTQIPAGIVGFA